MLLIERERDSLTSVQVLPTTECVELIVIIHLPQPTFLTWIDGSQTPQSNVRVECLDMSSNKKDLIKYSS